jgi:ectoine hydroxylase-related dioxygenase (phytanoyl-CoA dioxygenase family)
MDCLAEYEKLDEYFTSYFCGKYILNSFGGNILKKGMSYANEIHRDIRSFSGALPLMMNTLVFLDDFTHENGATWLMNRGHWLADKPTEFAFQDRAFQITGKAGSIAVWNSNLWHKAGENKTDKPRRSVTPELSLCHYKPGFDYCRALGYWTGDGYSPYLRQVLGFNSRVPKNLEEWYKPEENRMYKKDQG